MKRVFRKGEVPKGILINCDVRPVALSDGRTVLLTGREWYANATDERRLECARAIAYDEERKR